MRAFVVGLALALAVAGAIVAHASKTPRQLVDLNRATLLELMQLPGVGPSRAEAIVRYRDSHPFRRTADLLRIKGIGRRTFARLRPFVTVGQAPSGPAPVVSAPAAGPPKAHQAAPVPAAPAAKPTAARRRPVSNRPAGTPGATPPRAAASVAAPACDTGAGGSPQACPVPWRVEHSGVGD